MSGAISDGTTSFLQRLADYGAHRGWAGPLGRLDGLADEQRHSLDGDRSEQLRPNDWRVNARLRGVWHLAHVLVWEVHVHRRWISRERRAGLVN
jgi:hypothetical protein